VNILKRVTILSVLAIAGILYGYLISKYGILMASILMTLGSVFTFGFIVNILNSDGNHHKDDSPIMASVWASSGNENFIKSGD
jgi:high-affinity Fe2+/Pb2+ permease